MNEQKVKEWMTHDPITATSNTTLPQACRLMKENAVRHLPVVDSGKLVGIVTWEDIREASASEVMTLQIFELHYLLDRVKLRRIMTRNPIKAAPRNGGPCCAKTVIQVLFSFFAVAVLGLLMVSYKFLSLALRVFQPVWALILSSAKASPDIS